MFFSDKKIVESKPLNLLGLQVLRSVGARFVHRCRHIPIEPSVKDKVRQVERNGIVLWHDFLSGDHFNALRAECMDLPGSSRPGSYVRDSGPNRDARIRVSDLDLTLVPALVRFLNDFRLRALFEGAERRRLGDLGQYAKIERITQGEKTEKRDPQTELHSDIYFTSHKAWFYLTDVTMASGPLTYVEHTHQLTPNRLYRVYEHSTTMKPGDDPSRRVNSRERASLPKATVVVCPANTLVVANTCGYHARLQGVAGQERCSIHIEVRAKRPFRLDGGVATFSKN
ncbi:phytanoyl-CoA dioxygenase family protein [Hyphomicrobium sp. 99]|uniref:phytanoyl-CoA dioxygenase family protein n=1 Tax=Hyphomicrobium sp. 99 TaxID=1163419 RepID=UPI0005F85F51|nr:phytanoyl-CoA dioxygenase family protein [Hyphomicrobium sp. 99]